MFYVGKTLRRAFPSAAAMDDHSAVTNLRTKSYSEEYLPGQYAVIEVPSADVQRSSTQKLRTSENPRRVS